MWHIWKARNTVIFEYNLLSSSEVLRRVVDDMDSWSCRYRKQADHWNVWRTFVASCFDYLVTLPCFALCFNLMYSVPGMPGF
ncbi:hypothetical protein HU200_005432 [Digitaria exilis]|uniref:Uncharacterized protein n=1 Tax=Digitaria exilis TaxID=1010633 RepID=A0A835FRN1_9POAL|nr:hypothetical protein HU200_005432 [Digitaria exilis]